MVGVILVVSLVAVVGDSASLLWSLLDTEKHSGSHSSRTPPMFPHRRLNHPSLSLDGSQLGELCLGSSTWRKKNGDLYFVFCLIEASNRRQLVLGRMNQKVKNCFLFVCLNPLIHVCLKLILNIGQFVIMSLVILSEIFQWNCLWCICDSLWNSFVILGEFKSFLILSECFLLCLLHTGQFVWEMEGTSKRHEGLTNKWTSKRHEVSANHHQTR